MRTRCGAVVLGSVVLWAGCAGGNDLKRWIHAMPRPVLREEYHSICHRPCEWIGFSFSYPDEELDEIQKTGANMCTLGAMWNPIQEPGAAYGSGYVFPDGAGILSQTFLSDQPFDAVSPCLPTSTSKDSGCSWRLIRAEGKEGQAASVAEGMWKNVGDNSWPVADFPVQAPGAYRLELFDPSGTWIGWWGSHEDPYRDGQAVVSEIGRPELDFELKVRQNGTWRFLIEPSPGHAALALGPGERARLARKGFRANYSLGDWNNPGFPYLPDWFNERFPEIHARDQNGTLFMGGMFGHAVPSPGIEAPVLMSGGTRFASGVIRAIRDDPTVVYWVMGGEDLYATYMDPSRWFDYSDLALRHFREWLRCIRYPAIAELNSAWASDFSSFEEVHPPTQPCVSQAWLDWLDFRFQSMNERFGCYYQAMRSQDPDRLIATCNHGSLYANGLYAAMGARPEMYASACDAFETGQIMADEDPDLYNILYMETLNTLGKPYCPARLAYKKSDPQARGGGTSYTPEAARRYVYESLGGDAWHLGLIQWSGSLPDGEWGVAGTPAEKEIAKLFSEIRGLWPLLDDMHAIKPHVGVFLSHPTWALLGFQPSWQAFHNEAVSRHIPKLYVYDEQIKSEQADDFGLLVSIDNAIVDPEVLIALKGYLDRGGRLIVAGAFAERTARETRLDEESTQVRTEILARSEAASSHTVAEKVLREAGKEARPIQITSEERVTRRVQSAVASQSTDWPQDMREARSLGQSLCVERVGLRKVLIQTPTFYKTPEMGFRFEAFLDGPAGRIIASRDIPGGISDNSWQELDILVPVPAQSTLYLRATPDPRLPQMTLGWWGTRQDVYAAGSAFVDDSPVSGDRQVRLAYDEPVSAACQIESFLLSDGLNSAVVLINLSPEPALLEVDLSGLVPDGVRTPYEVKAQLSPEEWKGKGSRGEIKLPSHAAAVLSVSPQIREEEAKEALDQARRAASAWREQGALTDYVAYALGRAENYLIEGRLDKATALCLRVLGQIGVRASLEVTDCGGCGLKAQCFGSDGRPMSVTDAVLEFVPSPAFWKRPIMGSNGSLSLEIGPDQMPKRWDYEKGSYTRFCGPLRARLAVQSGDRVGQTLMDVHMPEPSRSARVEQQVTAERR